MKEFNYTVKDKNGIHARPAGMIVSVAKTFVASIKIRCGEKEADAKRLLSVMALGATYGKELTFIIDGIDEEKAEKELKALLSESAFQG